MSYNGLQKTVREFKTPDIEVMENSYEDKDYTVKIETDEFTCVCPKTGLPDFAKVYIEYIPDKYCVELRSFKYYIFSFRNVGIFHENAANRVLDDFVNVSKPRYAKIVLEFGIRGGIRTTVIREHKNGQFSCS